MLKQTALLVLLLGMAFSQTLKAEVGTAQVAPTILDALHIDPRELKAVRVEGTGILPSLQFK